MKKTFKIVAMLLMVLCVSSYAFAQSSNTSTATKGTILADADKVMDVNNYKDVDFSNFFANTNISNNYGDFVFAKKFDNLYLGTYYNGDLKLPTTNTNDEHNSNGTTDSSTSNDSVTKETTLQGSHSFATLFGLNGFALRLNANINLSGNTTKSESTAIQSMKTEFVDAKQVVEKSSVNTMNDDSLYYLGATLGRTNPDTSKVTLKAYASFGYTVNADGKLSETTKTTVNGKSSMGDVAIITNTVETKESTTTRKNSDLLSFSLGSQLEWGDKAGLFSVADLSLNLTKQVGSDEAYEKSTTVTNHVDNMNPENNYTLTENSVQHKINDGYLYNSIYGSYRFEYAASEKLTFGASLRSSVTIESNSTPYYWTETTTDDTRWTEEEREANKKSEEEANQKASIDASENDSLLSETTTSFTNTLAFGMKYQVKPALAINFGFNANLPSYTKSYTSTTDIITEDSTTTIDGTKKSIWSNEPATYGLNAGFVWNINENLSLDTVLNIGVKPSLQGILDDTMTIGVTYKM